MKRFYLLLLAVLLLGSGPFLAQGAEESAALEAVAEVAAAAEEAPAEIKQGIRHG